MTTQAKLRTYTLRDRGYDCNRQGQDYDCTAKNLLDAIRMLDGFGSADYFQPINDVRGCSTYAVYTRAPRHSGAAWSKIGVVYLSKNTEA